jgi:1-acyl-sn-glycerol-3-phosphate acyltransferase
MRKIKTKHGFIFSIVKTIVRIFKKKPKIYNLNEEESFEKGIIISNHSAASGPMTLSLYFPTFFVPWGTHEMTENYIKRWKYLYYTFYQKKLGYKKFKSFMIATLFAIISRMLYNGMQLIPTYVDIRYRNTIQRSIEHLETGNSVLIFPEDSNDGYLEKTKKYNNGFVYLCQKYYEKNKVDLPIYPIYFHKRLNAFIIGKKEYIQDKLVNDNSREQIAKHFKDITANLDDQLFALEKKAKN